MLHRARRAHHRRAAGLAPRTGAEVVGGHPPQASGVDGGPPGGVHLAGVAEALGDGQHRGQSHFDVLAPVVVLELEAQERSDVENLADAAGEGKSEHLRQLRSDLPGLPVDGVAAEEDKVERPRCPQGGRQSARGGHGVRARERLVAHVEADVRAPGNRLAQDVLRARRPERDHRARAAGVAGEDHPFCDGAAAVGVHLEGHAVAGEPAVLEAQRLGQRYLFGERRDTERVPRGAGHDRGILRNVGRARVRGSAVRCRVTLSWTTPRCWPSAPQQPTASPSGLRGSEAPTRRSTPSAVRSATMIWAQPTAMGSKGLIARTR